MTASIVSTTTTDNDAAHGASLLTMSSHLEANEPIADDASDYGDFTLDEQDIIHQLLANITPGNHTGEQPLVLTDIEDYEEPRGVRLPRTLGKELWNPQWMQPAGIAAQNSAEYPTLRHNLTTTNGKCLLLTNLTLSLTC